MSGLEAAPGEVWEINGMRLMRVGGNFPPSDGGAAGAPRWVNQHGSYQRLPEGAKPVDTPALLAEAQATIERVRATHEESRALFRDQNRCGLCHKDWPCPTVAALGPDSRTGERVAG